MRLRFSNHLFVGSAVALCMALGAACAPRSLLEGRERVSEVAAGCEDCVADLVSCVATSRGDGQFLQCRDLFAACQTKKKLALGSCENPHGDAACDACDDQLARCDVTDPDPARCDEDHAECLARLGAAASCGGAEPPPGSGGSGGECAECSAGAGGTHASASGSSSSGGTGGEGGSGPACHEPCQLGEPMLTDCSTCAAEVCAADAYCCTTAWDKYCVKAALDVSACGCTTSSCAHAECSPGAALVAGCSNCVIGVCAVKPSCCQIEWTSDCVVEASTFTSCGCAGF